MKKIVLGFMSIVLLTGITMNVSAQTKKVKKSKLEWKGYKVTGSHAGTIDLKSGAVVIKNGGITGGTFEIDMTSLVSTDLQGEYKGKLEGHLKSDDFFGVDKHPTAKLVLTKYKKTGKNSYQLTGDLTLKGITKSISFPASLYGNKATANLKIDRTQFNVKYGSTSFFEGLKDKAIYDEFDLVIDIEF